MAKPINSIVATEPRPREAARIRSWRVIPTNRTPREVPIANCATSISQLGLVVAAMLVP